MIEEDSMSVNDLEFAPQPKSVINAKPPNNLGLDKRSQSYLVDVTKSQTAVEIMKWR